MIISFEKVISPTESRETKITLNPHFKEIGFESNITPADNIITVPSLPSAVALVKGGPQVLITTGSTLLATISVSSDKASPCILLNNIQNKTTRETASTLLIFLMGFM